MPEPPAKRLKTGKTTARKFSTADEIRTSLRSQTPEDLTRALTELRNQFSVWPNEGPISMQDARLILAQKWLDAAPGAHDLFTIWEKSNTRQPAVIVLILSLTSSLLALLSSHYTFHVAGHPILRTLLTPPWMRKLNSYIGGSHTELLLVTLKLFNSMSAFAGGKERKSILESFAWETKSLPKLLNMRRKSKGDESSDALAKPDIRTLYILFCLSFVDPEISTQLKTAFLEQHKDVFFSIFRGLAQDPFLVMRKVLEICWAGIWLDPKIKRTLKIGLFSEITVAQLLKIYDRATSEDDDPEHVPADLAHHFLLATCTRPGVGICFKDRGWYPRKSETDSALADDDVPSRDRGGRIYNKILANILKTLKVNEDLRQQELALKIMAACPELVAGFWSAASLTLEPRLSSKWVANIAFFGSVLSLPIPAETFLLSDNSVLYHPTPPPLSIVLENILPSVNTKPHLSKGLLHSSGLVQHCTALALCKCLTKYGRVSQVFRSIETALEEDTGDGQWAKIQRDLEREIRHRVPEFQVIVAFASAQKEGHGKGVQQPTKVVLLAESAQRLLWMYHAYLPSLVAENRFDVGKLVQNFTDLGRSVGDELDTPARLNTVRQLHVLRLLDESDQFVWSGKTGSSGKTHLYVLLESLTTCEVPALRNTLNRLVVHLLSESIIFHKNQDEPSLWLSALPTARRSSNDSPGLPEDVSLKDEAATVIGFLDDCIQRCLKEPYRYIEDMQAVHRPETQKPTPEELPSPLVMTLLEQLGAKIASNKASHSDVFALAMFLRRLILRLSSAHHDLSFLDCIAAKIDETLKSQALFTQYPVTSNAIRREMTIMRNCLPPIHSSRTLDPQTSGPSRLAEFLLRIGERPIPVDTAEGIITAFEVVDWVRLTGTRSSDEIRNSADIVTRLHLPALKDLVESLDPEQKNLWDGLVVAQNFPNIRHHLTFDCLFLHSTVADILDNTRREILVDAALANVPTLADIRRVVCRIGHSLSASKTPELTSGLVVLMATIGKRSTLFLSSTDLAGLKEEVFMRCPVIVGLCMTTDPPEVVLTALGLLIDSILDPTKEEDREMVSSITKHWLNVLTNLGSSSHVSPWIRFMAPQDLLGLLQLLGSRKQTNHLLLETVIAALESCASTITDLHTHLDLLTTLRASLPDSAILESIIATIVDACVPVALSGRTLGDAAVAMSSLFLQSDAAWSRRFHSIPASLDVRSLLFQEDAWSESTVKILSAILYQSGCTRDMFASWLGTDLAARRSAAHLSQILYAYLDSLDPQLNHASQPDSTTWIPHLSRLLGSVTDAKVASTMREDCSSCICLVLGRIPGTMPAFVAALQDQVKRLRSSSLTPEFLKVGISLAKDSDDGKAAVGSLLDHGMQWAIRAFAVSDIDTATQELVDELVVLVATARTAKAHIAETLLSVSIQNRLADISAVALMSALLQTVPLKPLIVNRYLQTIVQHPQFFKVCAAGASRGPLRDQIINTLHVLFNLHPGNTCQVTHVQPLVRVYYGTSSTSDRKLLSIFQLFEMQRKVSVASLLGQWSSTPEVPSSNILEAVQSLDAILVLRTCLHFPKWRCLADQTAFSENQRDAPLYDPVFLILIFAQAMAEKIPESAFGWIELFRTNIVSLLIRALSAKDQHLREVARSQLAALWAHLETADMQEQPHVVYVLNILRNMLPPPAEPLQRLPSYTTLILLHALRGIFYPSNFINPLTARFLLQRPALDATDVPMLYGMLYSSSDDWKKERGWIIRFISDGMMSTDDWRVLKRRHTWELLAGLFQSSEQDLTLRNSILEVLANLTCNAQATTSLILKSSLLHWIEMQVLISTTEAIAWIKILENILLILDAQKLESSTAGEWRFVICRCLSLILRGMTRSPNPEAIFVTAAPVILRLSALPGPPPLALPDLLESCLKGLKLFETRLDIPRSRVTFKNASVPCMPPHSGQDLQVVGDHDALLTWGKSVEYLWQASMTLSEKPLVWDALTSRLLIWRSLVGKEGSTVGEWARMLAVHTRALKT
ncbi:ribosome 60S biogenesis N-terminal-domain-containing protein [Mycena alexandri]|uniref:Ribosome 60S biogenesis N-terminal-domain-containing protein n=1 Tax=Mycena alexandri TaxID=1745969 RepID=A0AAD6TFA0_9AGAR|nr:ribosome 60S biogenesis N-terminal-domain-containing protein [Mycena alexandri]